jgi:hypothetical protein
MAMPLRSEGTNSEEIRTSAGLDQVDGIHLVIGNCVLRSQNGRLSTPPQRHGFRANAILEYQCRNRRHGARGTPLLHTRPRIQLKALSFALRRDKATSKATVKSHVGRGFRARYCSIFNSLSAESPRTRQRSAQPKRCRMELMKSIRTTGKKTPGIGGWPEDQSLARSSTYRATFAAGLPKIRAARR